MIRRLAPLVLLAALILAVACSGSEDVTSTDIVSAVPWGGPETAHYRVLDSKDTEVGTLELSIDNGATGELLFHQYFDFPGKGFTNDAKVTVDKTTLLPKTSAFKIVGPQGNFECTATYDNGQFKAHRVGEDGERDDTVTIPRLAYDSWGDLFVWRTIDFRTGYDVEYTDVLSCTLAKADRIPVKLKLDEQEQVSVPAGDFQAWHLKIDSGGSTQDAWYTTDARHTLVRYDNGESTFELTEAP
ncbi:MAG TPA: DUF3108 domain-containing protein [Dehalococcoidia bacterium]|nr:DUF3108 domain-containing protein [Dehalococcoidia bacterium]